MDVAVGPARRECRRAGQRLPALLRTPDEAAQHALSADRQVHRVHHLRLAMKGEVERARYPSFFREFVRLEAEAVELHAYDAQVVNGLLQSEEYARAVFAMWRPLLDEDTVAQRLAARLDRQNRLAQRPAPLLSFVIEEAVVRRPLGGPQVIRSQLEQLLVIGRQRNVEIQIMPTERDEHAGLAGPFTLLRAKIRRRMGYVEAQSRGVVHSEPAKVQMLESAYGVLRAQP